MKRLIIVAKRYEKELAFVVTAFGASAARAAGHDFYSYVKAELHRRGIPHHEQNGHPSNVPSTHVAAHA